MSKKLSALFVALLGVAVLPHAAAAAGPAPAPKPAVAAVAVTDGTAGKIAECMAIWEPRTHMSKAEWRRTCITELKEFPTP